MSHDSFAELDAFYQQTLDYLYLKYHYVLDPLPRLPMTEQQIIEMRAYGELAAQMAERVEGDRFALNRDPKYSNGLPRRHIR